MGMLTNFEDKYMMCPIFKHIINREPIVGDFVLTAWSKGIVQEVHEPETIVDEFGAHEVRKHYDVKWIHGYSSECRPYYDTNTELTNDYDDFVIITKELFNLILNHIPENIFYKMHEIMGVHELYDDNPYHEKYRVYMLLYRIYTYLNSIISDDMDRMILLSSGIKKVLKKHKNNGFRDVLLGNGQVWRLKKKKKKGFWGRQIHHRNKKYEALHMQYREKSVSYYPIKRLDKEYEAVIS